jgi:hypothetical protein
VRDLFYLEDLQEKVMTAETLLDQLHKVRKHGPDSWMACCPAHDDKTPSLKIDEASDGTILVHCFAGCSAEEVMGAAGLKMEFLFPERDAHSFDDSPNYSPPRETRGEANLAHVQIRHLTAEAMIDGGHRLTPDEKKQAADDYQWLKRIDKLP